MNKLRRRTKKREEIFKNILTHNGLGHMETMTFGVKRGTKEMAEGRHEALVIWPASFPLQMQVGLPRSVHHGPFEVTGTLLDAGEAKMCTPYQGVIFKPNHFVISMPVCLTINRKQKMTLFHSWESSKD